LLEARVTGMNCNKLQNNLLIVGLILSVTIIPLCKVDRVAAQSPEGCSPGITNSRTLRTSLHSVLPSHLLPMSSSETYSPSNLFEVINGQADFYLKAGFVKLTTQRLKLTGDPSKWFEIYIYQMNRHLSAFAVYSGQRRPKANRLEMTPFAYQAHNALFFVHDCLYIELIGSDETAPLISAMQQFAQAFVNLHPVQVKPIPELSIFPDSGLIQDSLALLPEGAFGFKQFKDVFIADYQINDDQVTVFISRCPNPSEAAKISIAYQEYLLEYGGESVPVSIPLFNGKLIQLHNMFELVFTHNDYVGGVHQAPTQTAAETLAKQLSAQLTENMR